MIKFNYILNDLALSSLITKCLYSENVNCNDKKELENQIKLINQENKQLKDNWNKLREWIVYNKHNENTEQHYLVVDYGTLLGRMQELKQGSGSNE